MTVGQTTPVLMRDAFLDELFEQARQNPDIYLLSADFGAKALDRFREILPDQFIHTGISEQTMVDVGAGLALMGKTVFLYAMAPFITARCYEQIKSVVSSMNLPITLLSVGVGLGYDHATLTHFTPEDIAIMRALNGIEVVTATDAVSAQDLARRSCAAPRFRYVRLERAPLPTLYPTGFAEAWDNGFKVLAPGRDLWIAACGVMTHRALAAREALAAQGIDAGVIDVFRVKPLDGAKLADAMGTVGRLLTVEEQLLEGGFGSALAETLMDAGRPMAQKRLGLRDGFVVENGDRAHLHRLYGIDLADVVRAAAEW